MKICDTCGTTNSDDAKVCKRCGSPLQSNIKIIRTARNRPNRRSSGSSTATQVRARSNRGTSTRNNTGVGRNNVQNPLRSGAGASQPNLNTQSQNSTGASQKIRIGVKIRPSKNVPANQQLKTIPIRNKPNSYFSNTLAMNNNNNKNGANFPLKPIPVNRAPQSYIIPTNMNSIQDEITSGMDSDKAGNYSNKSNNIPPEEGGGQQYFIPKSSRSAGNNYNQDQTNNASRSTPSQSQIATRGNNIAYSPITQSITKKSKTTKNMATQVQYRKNQSLRDKGIGIDKFALAMTQALDSIKKNIGGSIKEFIPPKKKLTNEDFKKREERVPESLVEILTSVGELDNNIEATALVDVQGKVHASAISKRISESLIATIGTTLGNISQDIMMSLGAGELEFASLHGTYGLLFMAPVMKNLFLVLLTGTSAKAGLINIAKMITKKQIELYFAHKNLQKTPI